MHVPNDILIALATYNELDNLPSLVEAIRDQLPSADVMVVDDNSPDGTGAWCDRFSAEHPWFSCIHRESKQGLGTAARLILQTAIDRDHLWLSTMDADWSHSPELLPSLLKAAQTVDVAIGSRYIEGGRIEGWPWYRRFVSRVLNTVSCRMLRLPISDASGSFRVYRVSKLKGLPLADLSATGYSYLEELAWVLNRAGATFQEVPITFRDRQAGQSKASLREAWGKLATLLRLVGK